MAVVLKKPLESSPGIIIFTHKERKFFESRRKLVADAIDELKKQYIFGMHWGHYDPSVIPQVDIDFHLAGPGTLQFAPGKIAPTIPLCSRNFISDVFSPDSSDKFWDIISVGRPIRLKKLNELFCVLKKILAIRAHTTALIICPMLPDPDSRYDYVELISDYNRIFNSSERENITLLALSEQGYPFPLTKTAMAFYYKRSRVFTLFSEQEGESRVISEALLCGLPVVVRKTLRGGGRDYLNETNSRQFTTLDEAVTTFIDILSIPDGLKFNAEQLALQLRADFSNVVLVDQIKSLYRALGRPFEGELDLDSLDRRLPSHSTVLPENIRYPLSDDIRTERGFVRFCNLITGSNLPEPQVWKIAYLNIGSYLFRGRQLMASYAPVVAKRLRRALRG